MTGARPDMDVDGFRAAIAACLGLCFDDAQRPFLADVLRRRLHARRQEPGAYLSHLATQRSLAELGSLAQELTVPETYFFRHGDQYRALREIALPDCLARRAGERRLAIASLGCASGEEAYSLAVLVRGLAGPPVWDVSILGVDLNPAVLEKARRARFTAWALRETPDTDRRQWFRPEGREFVLDDRLRAAVRFEQRNLIDDDAQLWRPGAYDVVFCRNVIMYFAPEQARRVIRRIAGALRPGGYLFLGHAETLRGLSTDFALRHTHDTFYYQRLDDVAPSFGSPSASAASAGVSDRAWSEASTLAPARGWQADASWVESIRRASERVMSLDASRGAAARAAGGAGTSGVSHAPNAPNAPHASHAANGPGVSNVLGAPEAPAWDLAAAFELLRRERFAEALALVEALPPEAARQADVLLVRAVLLVQIGRLTEAEAICTQLLAVDARSAGAHYLIALCREPAGDAAAARQHHELATHLDPGFAMPRLHLGLTARRAGDLVRARRELEHALDLLQREDAPRLQLFGGGFGRAALVALCRAELTRCGGRS